VSKVSRHHLVSVTAVLILAAAIVPMAAGQAQHAPHFSPTRRFAQAADKTSETGFHAKLPPHISTLLGIAKDEERAVMQSVVRSGTQIQGLDVSTDKKTDIVLFVVDETTNNQTLYLTSPEGTLRRVVVVKAGVGDMVKTTEANREAFQKEKQFWISRLVPAAK
jgi:hypothetical protein